MKYKLLFILLFPSVLGFSQEEKIRDSYFGLSFTQTFMPAPEITKLYTAADGADLLSLLSSGMEGRLSYGNRLTDRFSVAMGVALGTSSLSLQLALEDDFTDSYNWPMQFYYNGYASYDFSGKYSLWINKKNDFGISAGFRWMFVFPFSASFNTNLFSISLENNSKEKSFLAPQMGLFYQRKLSQRWSIGLSADISVSKRLILEQSKEDPYFDIIGKDIILHGSVEQKYQQLGLGLEARYLFEL